MTPSIFRNWWMFALRGLIAIVFGVLALAWPGITLIWLVALFAAFALIGGGVSVVGAVQNRKTDEQWWLALLLGLVSLGAGVIAIIHPALTALVLVLLMGANAIATGVLDIALAIRLREAIRGEWVLVLAGLVSMVFGVLVFLFPGAGALALVWLIGVYAIASGILLLVAAWRLRRHPETSWRGGMGQPAT
jgi:uncharacterized membrane protein HdeD (DUF308 family)